MFKKIFTSINTKLCVRYEVGEVDYGYGNSCDEIILETFYDEKDAIKYIVELYINDLLKDNNFSNTNCKYYYRKTSDDMYSQWTSYNINDLQNYCKVNNKEEIKKYLYDYNVYNKI